MTPLEVSDFFSINIIDLSLLEDITLEDILTYRNLSDYQLLVGPSNPKLPYNSIEQYNIKSCNNCRWHIASMKGNNKFYIPEAHYELVNITDTIRGLIISMRDIKLLYINLEGNSSVDIARAYKVIEKLHSKQFKIHLICLQLKEFTTIPDFKTWVNHELDSKEYCLDYHMCFQVLVNKTDVISRVDLDQIWTQDISGQNGNIGIEIHIPYINGNILNMLERCYEKNIFPRQPPA